VPIRCQFVLWRIAKSLKCRVSSVVEQRFCKPLVGSSNLSPGTNGSGRRIRAVGDMEQGAQNSEAVDASGRGRPRSDP
jgi:hypothetical protein